MVDKFLKGAAMKQPESKTSFSKNEDKEQLLSEVCSAVNSIQYGYVQITIQNGKVVQIDKTEKIRINGQMNIQKGSDR